MAIDFEQMRRNAAAMDKKTYAAKAADTQRIREYQQTLAPTSGVSTPAPKTSTSLEQFRNRQPSAGFTLPQIPALPSQKQPQATAEETPLPTFGERVKKTVTGAGKSSLGGVQNVFGLISRTLESNIDQEPFYPFYESEIERLNKLLEKNPNALKRKNIEADIKMYENLLAGKNPASEMARESFEGSAADIERAKEGANTLGKVGVDVGVGVTQLLGDVAAGTLTGGSALVPMAVRSLGSGAYEAEQEGATLGQQVAYGAASAAVEVLTEKLFDGLAGAFGKGVADDVVEKVIGRLAKSDKGRTALRVVASAGGEGVEELISAAVNPILRSIYNEQTPIENYKEEDIADWAYEALIGAIIGGLGGGVNILTGQDALQNAKLKAQDRADVFLTQTGQTDATPQQQVAQQEAAQQAPQAPATAPIAQPQSRDLQVSVNEGLIDPAEVARGERILPDGIKPVETDGRQQGKLLHIDERNYKNVGDRKVNAFQFDNPELHRHYVEAANGLLSDLQTAQKGERYAVKDADGYFTEFGGVKRSVSPEIASLLDNGKLTYAQIEKALHDIIADNGQENYAAAKRVELVLDDMLTSGYEVEGYFIEPDQEYLHKKRIAEETNQGNEYRLSEAEWEALMRGDEQEVAPQAQQKQVSPVEAEIARIESEIESIRQDIADVPNDPVNQLLERDIVRLQKQADELRGVTPKETVKQAPTQKFVDTLPEGTGAASPEFAYQEKVNQQHSTDTAFTEAERQMEGLRHEDSRHQVVTDEAAMAQAQQRLDFDFDGEKADLKTKQDWDKADTTAAHLILRELVDKARQTGDYSEVIEWNKTLETQKSAQGQALQASRQFANSTAEITTDAAENLFSDKTKRLSKAKKAKIMDNVTKSAEALNAIPTGDTASVIDLIKQVSKIRGTEGVFSKDTSGAMSKALGYVSKQSWGFEFLKDVAAGQVRSIATDYNKVGFWSGVKTIRFSNMLSSFATVMRNLGGNQTFDIGDSLSNNVAIPFDMILSKISGTRSVAFDKSWFSEAKRAGSADGFIKSYIQVGLDVDVDAVQSKYETTPGRTFKMTGNPMERLLSTVQKWQGYALQSTDEFAKGGTAAEAQRGIDKLKSKGKIAPDALQDRATEIAKQRTFQDESTAAKAVIGTRSALNALHSTDSQGGTFGVGDLMIPFAQAPSNLATQAVNATPVGLAKSTVQFANAIAKARQGKLSADAQANIATNIGRGLTGTAGFAFFAGLAAKGILKIVGSDDKDKDALERAEGASGMQINADALVRWTKGESTEWRSGDKLINLGFLEHLNVQMAGGVLLAEAYKADGTLKAKEIAKASAQAVFQTLLELPAISQIQELLNGYKYSKAETDSGKAVDAAGTYLGSQLSSFLVPNLIASVARGLDDKVRDQYAEEGIFPQAKADIFSKIPGLRQTLPVKLDPWGKERTTGDNALLNFVNATLSPAKVNEYQTNAINKELFRLDDAGENVKYPTRKMLTKISNGGIDFELNAKEQNAFHNTAHQLAYKYMDDAIKSGDYMAMSDSEKADYLTYMYSLAIDTAKRNYFEKKGVSYSSDFNKAVEVQEAGMQPSTYYHYKEALKIERPEGGTPSQVQISKAVNNLSLSSEEKGALWTIANGGESDKNPFTGTLAQAGLPADETIKIMEEYKTIASEMDDYVKAEGGPGKSQVQAAYFRQWLYNQGFNAAEVDYIEDVFTTWQMIPIEKPSKKALSYAATYPR